MGMFDYLYIDIPLPVPPETEWQTKDLECDLRVYRIREDGTLWCEDLGVMSPSNLDAEKVLWFGATPSPAEEIVDPPPEQITSSDLTLFVYANSYPKHTKMTIDIFHGQVISMVVHLLNGEVCDPPQQVYSNPIHLEYKDAWTISDLKSQLESLVKKSPCICGVAWNDTPTHWLNFRTGSWCCQGCTQKGIIQAAP